MQPEEKMLIRKPSDPVPGMVHDHICRGKTSQLVKRQRGRACHPLAVLEVELVIKRTYWPEFVGNFCQTADPSPAHNLALVAVRSTGKRSSLRIQAVTQIVAFGVVSAARGRIRVSAQKSCRGI